MWRHVNYWSIQHRFKTSLPGPSKNQNPNLNIKTENMLKMKINSITGWIIFKLTCYVSGLRRKSTLTCQQCIPWCPERVSSSWAKLVMGSYHCQIIGKFYTWRLKIIYFSYFINVFFTSNLIRSLTFLKRKS